MTMRNSKILRFAANQDGDKEIYVTPRRPLGKELRRLDNGTSEGGIDPFHRVRVLKP